MQSYGDTSFSLDLPFSFPFYDGNYTSVTVSNQGVLEFGSAMSAIYNANSDASLIASPVIAPLWASLRTDFTGNDIYVDESVADEVTIRWSATNRADNSPVNFSVTLFQNGNVQFDYGDGNTNLSPTIGISSGDGYYFVLSAFDGASSLTDANSIEFMLTPGRGSVDMGAYEYLGNSADKTPPTIIGTARRPSALTAQWVRALARSRCSFPRH